LVNRALLERRRALEAARAETGQTSAPPSPLVRDDVRASWDRCAGGLPVSLAAAPLDDGGGTPAERWEASPIRRAVPGLAEELKQVAADGDMVAAVTDECGRILWSGGGHLMTGRAEQVHFTAGGCWDERSAGTNAPALALLTGKPASVFSLEHWCEAVHDWVCYAAPVRDAAGRTVGVIDLSTTWEQAHPLALATVTAMARLAEARLGTLGAVDAVAARAARTLELRALGHPRVVLDETPLLLPLRQLEIVCLLVLRGEATLDELHALLYGDRPVTMTTLKAEISHLRRAVGGAIASRPYRLAARCRADFVAVVQHLRAGRISDAVAAYSGPLLPASEAPGIIEHRHYVDVALRNALLRHGSPGDLLRFAEFHPYDAELIERAAVVADPSDPLLADAEARLRVADLVVG
jgi:hypothetical protein